MKRTKFAVLTIALSIMLCACCGGGRQSLSSTSPPSSDNTSTVLSQPNLFECVYEQKVANYHYFYVYRYIPDDTLYVVRANNGGVCQMFNGHNKAFPAHYEDDLKPYLNP